MVSMRGIIPEFEPQTCSYLIVAGFGSGIDQSGEGVVPLCVNGVEMDTTGDR